MAAPTLPSRFAEDVKPLSVCLAKVTISAAPILPGGGVDLGFSAAPLPGRSASHRVSAISVR